jgi:hypothetical protein
VKIGIITLHWATNYGAVLQAAALSSKLEELFNIKEVFIIDYHPENKKPKNRFAVQNIFKYFIRFLKFLYYLNQKRIYIPFKKRNFKYMPYDDINRLDYIICGSDQIWNTDLLRFCPPFFGIFDSFGGRTVAYAASDGGVLSKNSGEIIKQIFKNFSFVSVREKSMLSYIQEADKNVTNVCDPVFLPTMPFWFKLASAPKFKNYILIYRIFPDDILLKDAALMSAKTGRKIIEIGSSVSFKDAIKLTRKILLNVAVEEFISLFLYADIILTNSFHGTAFSIIFNKQFFTYKIKEGINMRIIDLLNDFCLIERYRINSNEIILEPIDYTRINKLIDKKRESACKFLTDSIK